MALRRALCTALVAAALLASSRAEAAPQPMTRDEIIGWCKSGMDFSYWWGHGAWNLNHTGLGSCSGSCPSCTHSGSYGADCSGFASKVWQIPSPIAATEDDHPYSTTDFSGSSIHWKTITKGEVLPGDAFTYNTNGSGHIFIYESGDAWGSMWAYECKGCSYGCVHNLRTATSSYHPIRRNNIVNATPQPEAGPEASPPDAAEPDVDQPDEGTPGHDADITPGEDAAPGVDSSTQPDGAHGANTTHGVWGSSNVDNGGCSCGASGSTGKSQAWLLAAALAFALQARRRRRA